MRQYQFGRALVATVNPAPTDLFSRDVLKRLVAEVESSDEISVASFRKVLQNGQALLKDGFAAGASAEDLVHFRAQLVDSLLVRAWDKYVDVPATLVAVGGYGRGELLPESDIDLLILYPENALEALRTGIEGFITMLWDIGLQVGHSVRSPAECAEQAADDITIITNMMEARQLVGDGALFSAMEKTIAPPEIWPADLFFEGKLAEQNTRHARFDETAYKLEPNTKESPGGLRDIQTIGWVAKRHFGAKSLYGLVEHGFLSEREYVELKRGQAFLWRVRFALHMLTGRCEDRLLFDHQIRVAELFGYQDKSNNLAVEQFMQKYYRNIKTLSALNDILLQLFSEAILHRDEAGETTPINSRFQARHGFIEVRGDEVFKRTPRALLEIFHLMQKRPKLTGIRAHTLRLMRRDRHLINDDSRNSVRSRRLFIEILRQRSGVTHALRRMNRYGILGRYLPNFGHIIGRMQYDLFHTLTVDEHTLFVIRNLRRLCLPRFDEELPFVSHIMQHLEKPELLMITGLFHDIAKGRGGDHSILGAEDAARFCRDHGISSHDTEEVCWLVRNHLIMSITAQRKDINDPQVVYEFAQQVDTQERLDRLFVLTVCDIRGTNPELWNSWKESLLTGLYNHTARTLERGLANPLDETELVRETRSAAAAMLTRAKVNTPKFHAVWKHFDSDYFLRHSATEIAWQTRAIIAHSEALNDDGPDTPLVQVAEVGDQGTTVFMYTRDRDYLFGLTTGVLAQAGLSIMDARISTTGNGYTVDSYMIAEADGSVINNPGRREEIRQALADAIANPDISEIQVTRRQSRRTRAFNVPTQVYFRDDGNRTVMELITADRPGLLSTVGGVFRKRGILVETAKIGTIGERAEDVFFITDSEHKPLKDRAMFHQLRQILTRVLDRTQ